MGRPRLSDRDLRRQIRTARAAEARDFSGGKRAVSATYDRASRRVIMELSNGHLFGFPVASIPALAAASDEELAACRTSGAGLHWEALDVDLSVPGLLMSSIGRSWKLRP
jgi:hypothetical protein